MKILAVPIFLDRAQKAFVDLVDQYSLQRITDENDLVNGRREIHEKSSK